MSRFGLQLLLPDAIACKELYKSLKMLISWFMLSVTHWRTSFNTEVYSHKMQYSIRQNRIQKTGLEIQVKNLREPAY